MQAVIELALYAGWLVYHTHDSRRSQAGFPDLCLVRGKRLIFAELKVGKNRVTKEQRRWIEGLREARQVVYVWTPSDWHAIEQVLAA